VTGPLLPDPGLIAALRTDLAAVRTDTLGTVLGAEATNALAREARVPALLATESPRVSRRTAKDLELEAARVLVRLLLAGEPVTPAELERALPTLGAAGALRLGLVTPADGGALAPAVDLRPVDLGPETLWFAADLGERHTGRAVHPDHVLSVGGASLTLASLTIRRPVGRALDLGTGCGIQAAGLTGHARDVVATDVSERALAYAAFNSALNGQSWDLRRGSLLDPVAGEAFDLVVSNPPFVVTPAAVHDAGLPVMTYRDGGCAGDELLATLVADLPAHLAPGGVAELLGNWEHREGEDWRERVAGWAAGTGADLWVVQRDLLDPAQYVETWLRDGGLTDAADRATHERAYAAWLRDFHERGVTGVGFGYVVLRRPAVPRAPWVRLEELTAPAEDPLGEHVAAVLDAVEWLASTDDAALATARLVTAPDITIEHHFRPGEADPAVILARQGGGFRRTVPLDTALAGLLGACDGELTAGQVAHALAALLDEPADVLVPRLLARVRDLVVDGVLVRP
jgi:methylase of polypeptide subunit release factors